jgi:putative F0F1-ATPase subunit (Ca2+/Mg2+ transporter)
MFPSAAGVSIGPGIACEIFHKRLVFPSVTGSEPDPGRSPGPLRYVGLGVQLAVTLTLAVLAGQWLDRRLHTGGLATFGAAFVGFGATMYWLIRQLGRRNGDS